MSFENSHMNRRQLNVFRAHRHFCQWKNCAKIQGARHFSYRKKSEASRRQCFPIEKIQKAPVDNVFLQKKITGLPETMFSIEKNSRASRRQCFSKEKKNHKPTGDNAFLQKKITDLPETMLFYRKKSRASRTQCFSIE